MSQSTTCNTRRSESGVKKFVYSNEMGVYTMVGDALEPEYLQGGKRTLRQPQYPLLLENSNQEEMVSTTTKMTMTMTAGSFNFGETIRGPPMVVHSKTQGVAVDERLLDENVPVLYGRKCECARTDNTYCPVGAELCRIIAPSSYTYRVQCEGETYGLFARYLFPMIIFMYCFFTCLLVASPKGKYVRGYIRKILCCWTEDRYQRELRQEIDRMIYHSYRQRMRAHARNPNRVYYTNNDATNATIHNHVNQINHISSSAVYETNGAVVGDVAAVQRVAVALKTRRYGGSNEEGGEETVLECAICLAEFKVGERLGNLKCGHAFHVEPCLKKWIQRRNQCPLCRGTGGADNPDNHGVLSPMAMVEEQRNVEGVEGEIAMVEEQRNTEGVEEESTRPT